METADILLAMGPLSEMGAALAATRTTPVQKIACSVRGLVVQEYASVAPWALPLLRRLERQHLAQADMLLANGYDTAAYLRERGFKSHVVPNGVDVAAFAAPRIDDPALADLVSLRAQGVFIISVIGTLRPIKGVEEAIRTVPHLMARLDRPFRLIFVGKGNPRRFQVLAAKLGVENHVQFLGEQKNVAGCLHLTDIVLSVSLGAGMSMSTLEAMAAARPIVAWHHPIYTQLIDHGETGLLVETSNSMALAAAVERCAKDPALAARLGKKAQQTVQAQDWKTVVDHLSGLLGPTPKTPGKHV